MASGQTANYQLNQWEAEDKVLRTEFNADNAKLDAALAGLAAEVDGAVQANPYQKLAHVAVTQAADTVTLDLSGVDLSQYQALELYAALLMGSENSNVSVLCNDVTDGYGLVGGGSSGRRLADMMPGTGQQPGMELLRILLGQNTISGIYQGNRWVNNEYHSYGPSRDCLRLDPPQLTKLKLVGEGRSTTLQILPGSEFTLYGLKK